MSQPLDYVSKDLQRSEFARRFVFVVLGVTLVAAAVAAGFQFNSVDDRAGPNARGAVAEIALLVSFFGVVALFVVGAAVMGRARPTSVIVAVIFVLLSVGGAMALFDLSGLGRSVGYITGRESMRQLAINRFVQRLYLCAAPTIIVGVASLLLARRSREWVGILAALLAGVLSAALWAGDLYGLPKFWLTEEKRAKFLSTGLFVLVLLLLCQLLAGAIEAFRRQRARINRASDPGYTPR